MEAVVIFLDNGRDNTLRSLIQFFPNILLATCFGEQICQAAISTKIGVLKKLYGVILQRLFISKASFSPAAEQEEISLCFA